MCQKRTVPGNVEKCENRQNAENRVHMCGCEHSTATKTYPCTVAHETAKAIPKRPRLVRDEILQRMHAHTIQIWIRIPSEVEKSCCSAYRVALTVRTEWQFAASPLTMAFPSVSLCRSLSLSLSLVSVNHQKSLSCVCACVCKNVLFLMALSTPLYRTSGDRYHAFRRSVNSKRLFFSFFFFFWSKCCYFRAVL